MDRVVTQTRFWLADFGPTNKLDGPRVVGTGAFFSTVDKVISSHSGVAPPHSTPALRSVAQGRLRLLTTERSPRICEWSWGIGCGTVSGFMFSGT
jgi:hypothetical protein